MNHLASDLPFPVRFQNTQFELAVVHEHRLACFHVPSELHVTGVNNTCGPGLFARANDQFFPFYEVDLTAFQLTDSQFGPLQIGQQSRVCSQFLIHLSDVGDGLPMNGMLAVRKVQARHVHSCLNQRFQPFLRVGGRAHRRYNFRSFHRFNSSALHFRG